MDTSLHIVKLAQPDRDALRLLREYYTAIGVMKRDGPAALQRALASPRAGLWLAYLNDRPVGCVMLRDLPTLPDAGECKRLYVQPDARGHGVAAALMDALEDFARAQGLRWIYLDSFEDLAAALQLYRKRGYTACERYNDNPQATVFLRKHLT